MAHDRLSVEWTNSLHVRSNTNTDVEASELQCAWAWAIKEAKYNDGEDGFGMTHEDNEEDDGDKVEGDVVIDSLLEEDDDDE